VSLATIADRARQLTAPARRGEVIRLPTGVTLVDDSYNASPAAVAGALEALATERRARRRIAVLGEMRELGEFAVRLHEETGRCAVAAGVDVLVAIGGDAARALADEARTIGLTDEQVRYWKTSEEAAEPVAKLLQPGDVVLVKGSRGTRTDIVADRIRAEWA
jgi:UDP-N-acetylmuramoyl-tripeptide--D-alanyl-D-alanine ligase